MLGLFRRKLPAPPPSPTDIIEALAKDERFTGFIAWRAGTAGEDESWRWIARGMTGGEIIVQLEQAAEQVMRSVPLKEKPAEG